MNISLRQINLLRGCLKMAINPHLCSFCNQKRSTVAIGLDGTIPHIVYKKSKFGFKAVEANEKWDRPTRYLCYNCLITQIKDIRIGKYKVIRDQKTQINIPRKSHIIFFQNEELVRITPNWSDNNKCFECWLPVGEYQFIRIDEKKKPKRKRINKKETPLFGDMSNGMMDFQANQGHQVKK